jgi:hypothetical protein
LKPEQVSASIQDTGVNGTMKALYNITAVTAQEATVIEALIHAIASSPGHFTALVVSKLVDQVQCMNSTAC